MEINSNKDVVLNTFESKSSIRIVKVAINEDIYKKIKALGVLVSDDKSETVLLGSAINKLYDLSKNTIAQEFFK